MDGKSLQIAAPSSCAIKMVPFWKITGIFDGLGRFVPKGIAKIARN
jgi:hypothetical protein